MICKCYIAIGDENFAITMGVGPNLSAIHGRDSGIHGRDAPQMIRFVHTYWTQVS
jgi:hypothetical protein